MQKKRNSTYGPHDGRAYSGNTDGGSWRGHKLQGDWQAALGVTVRVPHLTWTSMAGEAKRDYPAAIGYQSPWYKEYPYVENYFARVNTALTRGIPHVRMGVIHPIESYWLYWGPKEQTAQIREEMDDNFLHLIEWLLYGTMDFDFIAESLLKDLNQGQEECPLLKVGHMNYDAVLVPNCKTLRSSTLEILEKFRERGGRVIFAGELPWLEDAVPSERGRRLAEKCEQIPFAKNRILNALRPLREVEIKEADGRASTNLIYQMREDGENRWLFIAHVNRTAKTSNAAIVIGGEEAKMKNQDLPWEEKLLITVSGEWKVVLFDAVSGKICPVEAEYRDGNTILKRNVYDQDSLLLQLLPVEKETVVVEREVQSSSRQMYLAAIPNELEVEFSEPNVSILDLAEYRFDNGEWQAQEEILRIDNKFREKLGYPMRMEAFAQPWTNSREEGYEHKLSLRFGVEAEADLTDIYLAMENDSSSKIFWDDVEVENKTAGWYTDHCIRTVLLPPVQKGKHCLRLEIPYNSKVNIEAMFLLGDFRVNIIGTRQILALPDKKAAFGDLTRQGYPFYGGNVTYKVPFESNGNSVKVRATMFRSPVIGVSVDGEEKGYIAYSPYEADLGILPVGKHCLELTVFGNRVNTFGTLHNCNQKEEWYGPNAWRSEGDQWSYEYQLRPFGLLKEPMIKIELD